MFCLRVSGERRDWPILLQWILRRLERSRKATTTFDQDSREIRGWSRYVMEVVAVAAMVFLCLVIMATWPLFFLRVTGWSSLYAMWALWYIYGGRGEGRPGRIARGLRAALDCEWVVPLPHWCRRVIVSAERRRRDRGVDEYGNRAIQKWGTTNEDIKLRVLIGTREVTSDLGVPETVSIDEPVKKDTARPQQPVFQLEQPSLPDRRGSLRTNTWLSTIHEVVEEPDIEASKMAHLRPIKPWPL